MINFRKIIFFNSLISFIFSIIVTKIEPTTLVLEKNVNFNLTIENDDTSKSYDSYDYYFGDNDFREQISSKCDLKNETLLICTIDLIQDFIYYFYNLTKILYVKEKSTSTTLTFDYWIKLGKNTGLAVTFTKPTKIKINNLFNYGQYYPNMVSKLIFDVNNNELYNSKVNIYFSYIYLNNCKADKLHLRNLYCYYEFKDFDTNYKLNLTVNGEKTNISIDISKYPNYSYINIYGLNKDFYFVSSSIQNIYLSVDSYYGMNNEIFTLVPSTTGKSNITLSSCTYYDYDSCKAKCSAILNTIGVYYLYNGYYNTSIKLFVYPKPSKISKVYSVSPDLTHISSSLQTFTLKVDYIVNIDDAVFTLVNDFNNNKVYLTNCRIEDEINNKISCVGTIENAGDYYIYLNGVLNYNAYVVAKSSSLSKVLFVPFKLNTVNNAKDCEMQVVFDSLNDFSSKNVSLVGTNNNKTIIKIEESDLYDKHLVHFSIPAADIYNFYIDDVKQDLNIIITNDKYKYDVTSISPTSVIPNQYLIFTLKTDKDPIENYILIDFINEKEKDTKVNGICKSVSYDKYKIICWASFVKAGTYYIEKDINYKNINVTVKVKDNLPTLYFVSPISISPSSESQTILLYYKEDISMYINKVIFVGTEEKLKPNCETKSNYVLSCSTVFKNEGDYYLNVDDITVEIIHVNREDNINKNKSVNNNNSENNNDENNISANNAEEHNIKDDNKNNMNNLNKIILLLLIILIF